jgi:hypothetical protein
VAKVTEFDLLLGQAGLDEKQRALIELMRRHIQALWHHVELLESALKVGSDGDIVVKGTKITIAGTGSVTINSGSSLALFARSTLSLSGLSIAASSTSAGKVDFKTGHLTSNGNKIPTQDEVQSLIKDARHRVLDTVSRAMRSGGDPAAFGAQEELIERRDALLKSRPAP